MILVNSAMMQKEIIQLLEENGFKHTKKQGLKLFFETPTDDASMAKQLIKGSSFGAAVFFNVSVV
ncbi:hypothetical protein [Lactococcus cremoris]|uniref:hypothetical protein n=1 Tax=Lactococcus lactis subsp. cremoris TaxID=1359 RepID=UPI0022073B5B|nr:hypothetical protein [Lactococcus cremoris]UXV61124.1 hypothetical protein LLUC073_00890 [Lactococcus cremoris]